MIVMSPFSVVCLLGSGAAGAFIFLCLRWRMWLHGWVLCLCCAGCFFYFVQDATRDRSVDGGVFTRGAGDIIWQKAGFDD